MCKRLHLHSASQRSSTRQEQHTSGRNPRALTSRGTFIIGTDIWAYACAGTCVNWTQSRQWRLEVVAANICIQCHSSQCTHTSTKTKLFEKNSLSGFQWQGQTTKKGESTETAKVGLHVAQKRMCIKEGIMSSFEEREVLHRSACRQRQQGQYWPTATAGCRILKPDMLTRTSEAEECTSNAFAGSQVTTYLKLGPKTLTPDSSAQSRRRSQKLNFVSVEVSATFFCNKVVE